MACLICARYCAISEKNEQVSGLHGLYTQWEARRVNKSTNHTIVRWVRIEKSDMMWQLTGTIREGILWKWQVTEFKRWGWRLQSIPGRGNSKCKGPEDEINLGCSGIIHKGDLPGGRKWQDVRRDRGIGLCRAVRIKGKSWNFIRSPLGIRWRD